MVERIMLFKLVDSSARDEVAALMVSELDKLPGLEELSIGLPADPASEKSWDVSVVMGFANQAALATAIESPAFDAFIGQKLSGRIDVVKGWSFERLG